MSPLFVDSWDFLITCSEKFMLQHFGHRYFGGVFDMEVFWFTHKKLYPSLKWEALVQGCTDPPSVEPNRNVARREISFRFEDN